MDERDDERDKEQQLQRYRRAEKHHLGRDEEQRRKAESRKRHAERARDAPRQRDLDPDDDATFGKIKRVGETGHARGRPARSNITRWASAADKPAVRRPDTAPRRAPRARVKPSPTATR